MIQLRNLAHYILYFIWSYSIFLTTGVTDWKVYEQVIFAAIFGFVFGGVFGSMWEWCQSVFLHAKFDNKDVLRSIVGAILGGYTAVIYNGLHIISTWGLYASFALVLFSAIKGLILMRKRGEV